MQLPKIQRTDCSSQPLPQDAIHDLSFSSSPVAGLGDGPPGSTGQSPLDRARQSPRQLFMRPQLLAVGCALLWASLPLYPTPSSASTAIRLDVEELVQTADLVLEGRILMQRTSEDERGRIVTDTEIDVLRTFSGTHRARRTVRLHGGVLADGRASLLPGQPELRPGEQVILALSAPGEGGLRYVTGLSQGKYRVLDSPTLGTMAVRGGGGATLTPGAEPEEGHAHVLPYVDLVARLQAAAASKAAQGGR